MAYGVEQSHTMRFTLLDTGQSIGADFDATVVPPDQAQGPMMQALMSSEAIDQRPGYHRFERIQSSIFSPIIRCLIE